MPLRVRFVHFMVKREDANSFHEKFYLYNIIKIKPWYKITQNVGNDIHFLGMADILHIYEHAIE